MKRKSSVRILLLSWIVLSLVVENRSQVRSPDDGTQDTSPGLKEDISTWQTILLSGKGIKFKLPRDWQPEGEDLENKNEYFTLEETGWSSPNKGLIRFFITTPAKGLVSLEGTSISKEEAVQLKFKSVTHSEGGDPAFGDVKKLKISGVEGVFRRVHIAFKDKDVGERTGIIWTGYRIYRGKAQEVEINISAQPKGEEVLQIIFNTLDIEQDKDPKAKL